MTLPQRERPSFMADMASPGQRTRARAAHRSPRARHRSLICCFPKRRPIPHTSCSSGWYQQGYCMLGDGEICLSGKNCPGAALLNCPGAFWHVRKRDQMRERASSSATRVKSPWSWRMEAGTCGVTGPKKASRMA